MNDNYNDYKHRMSRRKIKINGTDGKPLKKIEVVIEQKAHKFLFGCSEFSCIPFANGDFKGDALKKAEERFEKFTDLFNYTTLPFYWSNFERVKGQPDTERLKIASQWLMSKGFKIKGHPLCWHTLAPDWLLNMSNSEILSQLLERIKRDVTDFIGLVDIWDVINEVVIMPMFNKYDNGITRICKEMGRIRLVRETFLAAKNSNPDAVLLINDFINTGIEGYDILVNGCLEAGIPIDAIGIQAHMHQGYWGVERTEEVLEIFSRYKLPIHFTENSLVSGHLMPQDIVDLNDYVIDRWESTPEGEERQAEEAVMHYKTLFKHPLVESITWWDFVDGQWLGAPVGFTTQDNRIKPIYNALHKLIKSEWWTNPIHTATDDSGSVIVEGFLGEYEVKCGDSKGKFMLDKGNEDDIIEVSII